MLQVDPFAKELMKSYREQRAQKARISFPQALPCRVAASENRKPSRNSLHVRAQGRRGIGTQGKRGTAETENRRHPLPFPQGRFGGCIR